MRNPNLNASNNSYPEYIEDIQESHRTFNTASTPDTFKAPNNDETKSVTMSTYTAGIYEPSKKKPERKLDLDDFTGFKFNSPQLQKKSKSKRKKILLLIILLATIAVFAIGLFLTLGEKESPGNLIQNEDEDDFCQGFALTDDEVRVVLASDFDIGIFQASLTYNFNTDVLECLPENAFSNLTETQKDQFQTFRTLSFIQVDLFKIHPNAFQEEVNQIETLFLIENNMVELPENVFKSFKSMTTWAITDSSIVTLNNSLFGEESSLRVFRWLNASKLVSFPEFMRETPEIEIIQLLGAISLVNSNSAAFENLDNLRSLEITEAPVLEVGFDQLALDLGINVSVFI